MTYVTLKLPKYISARASRHLAMMIRPDIARAIKVDTSKFALRIEAPLPQARRKRP